MRRAAAAAAALAAVALLLALGVWQLERLRWKEALIARVEQRLAATPVPAPGPSYWKSIDADAAYRRVRATGRYLRGADTFTQAVTAAGPGFWVLTPLATRGGWHVLVNRGFVPVDVRRSLPPPPGGDVAVQGLLRVTEPDGGFLRSNDAAADRWYSRDVAAIAATRGVADVAPYFIDADGARAGWPRGGMTVVTFRNHHLIYALTWFALAGLAAWFALRLLRRPR